MKACSVNRAVETDGGGLSELDAAEVRGLEVVKNRHDPRRDLHAYLNYVGGREVKRSVRGNDLPKADLLRLAKLMTDPGLAEEVARRGESDWVDFIDSLALALGAVSYDTKGEYRGYHSMEPSFTDNVVEIKEDRRAELLSLSIQQHEQALLDAVLKKSSYNSNELLAGHALSRLDRFGHFGCATGVLPTLDFAAVRRFLLDILGRCEAGVWYSTTSLVRYLKKRHRFFLIPEKFRVVDRGDRITRYGNFSESSDPHGMRGTPVAENAADAFERVEGRYVERFLEGIPLLFGYVEVAYDLSRLTQQKIYPSREVLQAFRICPHFKRFRQGQIAEAQVVVQPNFEVHVESELFPHRVLSLLDCLAEVVRHDRVTVLKLTKNKAATALTVDRALDPVARLAALSCKPIPENVVCDLKEWSAHSTKFTLFEGVGIWESGDKTLRPPLGERFLVQRITPALALVSSPDQLFAELERQHFVPLMAAHPQGAIASFGAEVETVFPKKGLRKTDPPKQKLIVTCEHSTTVHFPSQESLEDFQKRLKAEKCPFSCDESSRSLTYAQRHQPQVDAAMAQLRGQYVITLKECT